MSNRAFCILLGCGLLLIAGAALYFKPIVDEWDRKQIGSTGLGQALAELEAGQHALYREIVLLQKKQAAYDAQIEQFLEAVTAAPPGGSPLDQYATPVPGKPGWMRVNINDLPEHMRPELTDEMKAAVKAHAEKQTNASK